MEKAEIRNKVTSIIAQILRISKEGITEEVTLEDLGADSLNRVEFVMELEESFGVEIKDEDAETLDTLGQTVDYIHKLIKEKGA